MTFIHLRGHQRISLPLASVLPPAGIAKEMTQTASRQIHAEVPGKNAYQYKELDAEYVSGLKPKAFVLRILTSISM